MSQIKAPLPNYRRQWVKCKKCGDVAYYDFVPKSLSNPIRWLTCGHSTGQRFNDCVDGITADEAICQISQRLEIALKSLKRIKEEAHLLAFACNLGEKTGRRMANIFWLAVAGLEGRKKASALDTFTTLSGIPTGDPKRQLSDEEKENIS